LSAYSSSCAVPFFAGKGLRHLAETEQPLEGFIPQIQTDGCETLADRQGVGKSQFLDSLETGLQVVVRNSRLKVMDMMQADIARKPLQHRRQFVEGASLHCGVHRFPIVGTSPICRIELVLHVKEPNAAHAGDKHDRQLNEQIGFDTDGRGGKSDDYKQGKIGQKHASFLHGTGAPDRNALDDHKEEKRTQTE